MVLSFSIGCLFQKIKILILIKLSSLYVNNFLSPLLIRKFFIFWNKHSIEKLRTILNLNFWRRYFWRVYYIWPLSWPIAHRTCLRESRNNVLYRIRRWSNGVIVCRSARTLNSCNWFEFKKFCYQKCYYFTVVFHC